VNGASRQPSRSVDQPEPGWFEMRLVKGGPPVAARITRDEQGLWGAWIDGVPCGAMHTDPTLAAGVFRIWHGGRFCTEAEHDYRLAMKAWALEHDGNHPAANPTKPINLGARAPLF
jgi:hypothetical protein